MLAAMATVGGNIKRLRRAAGLKTQGDLAKKLGVPQPQASDWENDRYNWPEAKLKTLLRIAKAVDASIDDLLANVDADYDILLGQRPARVLPQGAISHNAETAARLLAEERAAHETFKQEAREAVVRLGELFGEKVFSAKDRKPARTQTRRGVHRRRVP